jgi:hypothetical protein
MKKFFLVLLASFSMVMASMGTAHAQFEAIMAQLLQQAASVPTPASSASSTPSAVSQVINTMSNMTYVSGGSAFTPNSPSQTLSTMSGNCNDLATYFTNTLQSAGLNTERVAEDLTLPNGQQDGHVIGIATNGVNAWLESDTAVQMFPSVQAAVANGGVGMVTSYGAGVPAGTQVSGQVVYGGTYIPGQQIKAAQGE